MALIVTKDLSKASAVNKRKLLICLPLGLLSFIASVVLLVIDPIQMGAKIYTRISPNSAIIEYLKKEMEGVHISVYLFNISNAEEFMSGEQHKLKMQDIGPFTYTEIRNNEKIELDMKAGVLRYTPTLRSVFTPEESIGRPEDFNVTMPNMLMLGLSSMMSPYPFVVRMAFNLLTRRLDSRAVVTTDAEQYLWGYTDPLLKLAHTVAPHLVNFDKLGFFDRLYDKKMKNQLELAITDKEKFLIKTRNGHDKLKMSPLQDVKECKQCDTFENAYEGLMFPSPVRPDMPIRLFRSGLCKIVDMVYHEKTVIEDHIQGLVFNISDRFYSAMGSNDGLLDLSSCFNDLPAFLSKVHFMDVDPKVYERIDGIKPDRKYDSYVIIEPIVGVGIETYLTIQINLKLNDLSFNSQVKRFSNMVLPILYIEIKQPKLDEDTLYSFRLLYVIIPTILLCIRIILLLVSFILLAYNVYVLYVWKFCKPNVISFPNFTTSEKQNNILKVEEPLMANFRSR